MACYDSQPQRSVGTWCSRESVFTHDLTRSPDWRPFYLTSWHERCSLPLYEFWVTLLPVCRTRGGNLSVDACSLTGQEAARARHDELTRGLKLLACVLNKKHAGMWEHPESAARSGARSRISVWWWDVTLSEAGWGFFSWEVERRADTLAWSELFPSWCPTGGGGDDRVMDGFSLCAHSAYYQPHRIIKWTHTHKNNHMNAIWHPSALVVLDPFLWAYVRRSYKL